MVDFCKKQWDRTALTLKFYIDLQLCVVRQIMQDPKFRVPIWSGLNQLPDHTTIQI